MTVLMAIDFKPEAGRVPKYVSIAVMDVVKESPDQSLNISIKTSKKYSSNKQLRYYFGVIIARIQGYILMNTGKYIDEEELHAYFMIEVGKFTRERHIGHGEIAITRRSYTDLSTTEAEAYHTKLRRWAAERDLQIPEPREGN